MPAAGGVCCSLSLPELSIKFQPEKKEAPVLKTCFFWILLFLISFYVIFWFTYFNLQAADCLHLHGCIIVLLFFIFTIFFILFFLLTLDFLNSHSSSVSSNLLRIIRNKVLHGTPLRHLMLGAVHLFQPRYTAICEVKDMKTAPHHHRRSSSRQPADIPFRLQLLSCCDCSCRFDRLHFTPIHWHCYFKIPTENKETKQRSRNSSMFEPAWFALLRLYDAISDRERKYWKINAETE